MINTSLLIIILSHINIIIFAKDCLRTSIGQTSLKDLGINTYQSQQGGLYPLGSNTIATSHENAGISIAKNKIYPRDLNGNLESTNGKILFMSIGMSNTMQEWTQFITDTSTHQYINNNLVIYNGAAGGVSLDRAIAAGDPYNYWPNLNNRILNDGYDAKQVQIIWLKTAYATQPQGQSFPTKSITMKNDLITLIELIMSHFPNTWMIYTTSRIYGDYSDNINRKEPLAFEGAFGFKYLIEEQIAGTNPILNFDEPINPPNAPYIQWGPYIWADGMTPTNGGLIWECNDYKTDGVHPSDPNGIKKVSNLLMNFFLHEPTAIPWFKSPTNNPTTLPSKYPTTSPTQYPSVSSSNPTKSPSKSAIVNPNKVSTHSPSKYPTRNPSKLPTRYPSKSPNESPLTAANNSSSVEPIKVLTTSRLLIILLLWLHMQ